MAHQQSGHVKHALEEIISQNSSPETFTWLLSCVNSAAQFSSAFVSLPRKTGKNPAVISEAQHTTINTARPGFSIRGWTIDRICRVWLLIASDSSVKERYIKNIEHLFPSAEINELIALYSALPVLAYPDSWTSRCSEGIRSNIGDVLTAIMCNNPYPSENLSEAAWNQLVLKAFFTEKPVHHIIGVDSRANERLARTLSDYAHERWAAGRSVHPQLWRNIGKFLDEGLFTDIEKLVESPDELENEAAALACHDSNYPPAKAVLHRNKNIQSAIISGQLTWNTLAEKTSDYVLQQ